MVLAWWEGKGEPELAELSGETGEEGEGRWFTTGDAGTPRATPPEYWCRITTPGREREEGAPGPPDGGDVRLEGGDHQPQDGAMNIMELTARISGEEWSSRPSCVSPALADFLNHLADNLPQGTHQRLQPLAGELIGSNCPGCEELRVETLANLALHESLPTVLKQRRPPESRATALMDADLLAVSVWPPGGNGRPDPHRAAVKAAELALRATELPWALAKLQGSGGRGEAEAAGTITEHVRAALRACRHREETR